MIPPKKIINILTALYNKRHYINNDMDNVYYALEIYGDGSILNGLIIGCCILQWHFLVF